MAKQLNVSLAFTADTGKAKAQLRDLQNSLDKLINSTSTNTSNFGLTKELAQAATEASKLKIMLESATNSTGGLDLGKFNQNLKQSGMELKDYAEILSSLGPEGSKTFAKLAQSITTANVPLKQTNKLLDEFATTMKNTIRWQFSSSMLHGFMGAVSGALGYAKDLDKSLNDIRIVTGYNTDQMAQFAEEANRAAKALSSTTTDYTNASLIYYQQGLDEDEIAKRTEVTLKMANAAGVSAQTVSDQMTAVWNNFDDGSKSLEYYADVMTALGAATASSTDEISAGLNKFAAVAETVGLSYEYATAALATVTSTTRESADVVGTAFKTLFARIQGLNLGETLDDGTTLNKYSQALEKVGISIFQSNGEMKEMNDILDEMGAKWNALSKDQQTALAQTVAGVRQYTQLVALMDNWNFFKENVKTAETATGALQKQADIYAESWEASSKRVKAAAQGIYDKLIDEDFFIEVNNVLEGILTQVGNLIDGLGGLPGVLSVVSTLMLKAFGKDIFEGIGRVIYNIKLTSEAGRQEIQKLRKDANDQLANLANDGSPIGKATATIYKEQFQLQDSLLSKIDELRAKKKELTDQEQKLAQSLLDTNSALGENYIQSVKNAESSQQQQKTLIAQIKQKNVSSSSGKDTKEIEAALTKAAQLQKIFIQTQSLTEDYRKKVVEAFSGPNKDIVKQQELLQSIQKHFNELEAAATEAGIDLSHFASIFEEIKNANLSNIEEVFNGIEDVNLEKIGGTAQELFDSIDADLDEKATSLIKALQKAATTQGEEQAEAMQTILNLVRSTEEAEGTIKSFTGTIYTTGDSIVAMTEGISALVTGISALQGLGDIWSNEDLTYGEKILSTITTLASIIPIIISSYQSWNAVKLSGIKNDIAQAAINLKLINQEGIKTGQQAVQNGLLTKEIALEVIKQTLNIKKLAITLALVAAIGALIAVGKALYDNYNKEAIAAKRLADSYKELNKASQEARAEADKLNSTISGYDDAVEKLEACTRGTEEWRDALKEVNEAAIEVIENLPDALPDNMKLTDLYSRDSNGMIVFDNDKLDQVQNSVNLDAESAAYAASAGDVRAQQAQITSDSVDLFRDMVRAQNNMAIAAASSGTTSPVNYVDGRSLVDNLEELSNLPFEEFKNKLEDLGVETAYLADTALADYQDQINKLAESSEFAAEKLDLITRVKVDDVLGDDYDSETKDIAARDLSSEEERLRNEYLEKYTGWGINQASGSNNDIYQTILKDLRDAGYDYDAQKNNAVRGNDKNRSFAFLDKNGDEVIRTAEWVAETVAASKALQNLEASAEEASTWLGNLDKNASDSTASGVRSVISGGDLSGLTQNEITQLSNDMGGADGNLISDEIINYLKTTMGITDDADLAKVFGVNNVGEVASNWLDIISSTNEQFAKIVTDLPAAVRGIFEGMDLEKFSLNEQGIIGNLLVDAFENGGTKGAKELENILNSMFIASGEDADDLAKALGGVNWQTTNISELTQILDDAGIETNGFADELAKLIGLMQEGQNVGFEAASEHYNTMKDMADLKEGDTITEEQYKYLVNAGIDVSEYFKLMGDGSYALKEDAEEFYRIVNEKSLDVFKSNIKAMYEEIGSVDGIMRRRNEDSIVTNNVNTDGEYNQSLVSDQLTFLEALGVELENLEVYQKTVEEGRGMSVEALQEIQRLVEENKNRWDELPESIQASAVELEKHQQALANSASTVDELNRLYEEQFITLEQYQEAVNEVMENEFEMEGLDPDAAEEVADAFRDMAEAGAEGMEALKNDEEAVKDATVRYMELNEAITDIYDNYKDYTQVLKDVRNATSKADRAMAANSDSAKKLKVSMAGLLGTTEDMIDADLMAAIDPKDFEAAANGNAEAIERIRNQFIDLQAQIYGCESEAEAFKQRLAELPDGAYIDLNTDPFLDALIQAAVQAGATATDIENMLKGFSIDADVTPFTEELWQATQNAQAAGQNIANATSFTTEVETADVDASSKVELPQYQEVATAQTRVMGYNQVPMSNGFTAAIFPSVITTTQKRVDTSTVPQTVEKTETAVGQSVTTGNGTTSKGGVIVKNAHKATAASKTPSVSNTSRAPVGSSGGGGGGSTPKAPDKIEKRDTTSQADVVERYREINDSIDNVTDALTRAERATARLWGKDKLAAMREENKILEEQRDLILEKAEEAEKYAKEDAKNLRKVAKDIGVSVVINQDTGDITNIEDVEETLYNRLAAAEAEYNAKVEAYNKYVASIGDSPTQAQVDQAETMKDALDAYEEDIIEKIEKDIETWEEAEQQFQDSIETWEDAGLEAEEILDQMMQKNFDIWSESLQLEVEVNDRDLELLDYYLSKTEDNVYQMAEAAALMVGNLNSGFEGGQLGEYLDNLSIYGEKYSELTERLNSTDPEYQITSAQYKEGLEEIQSGLLDNLSSIQELDDAMLNYYGDTLSMVGEEIDKYTEKMEHQTSILEHYANMMDILGKSQDYKAMGTILEGQVKTIQNELDVAEAEYDLYASEAEKKRKLYEEAVVNGDAAAAELYKGEWEAAEEAAMEAQSNMLDKTEQWAEAMKAVVENKLQGLAKSLEEALTGGTSFDQINTQLERAASLQEEYLTTTNQIYETNKLMRTAQQAMDKSTNSVAKQRLKDFIKETDQLQDKSKLSKYELEIQQAKYDLLLAEMALEDAQNAKTTVRLQRDSEGNMGYVYTADQSQLSQAQQQLEDAQNSLYNIGLEGANSYTEKYNQTMQEMYDTLTSISEAYYNGEIASQEEYEAQMLAAQEYYYEQLENFQDLYGIALQTDTRVIKDAWSTGMGAMKIETRTWKEAVSKYTGEATETLTGWYDKVDEIAAKTGLDNIANKVNNVTTESQNLKDTILGVDGDKGVIGALKDELTAVGDLTGGYANLRTTIQGLITDYENLMKTVNNAQNQQQSDQDKADNGTGNDSGNDNSTTQNDGSGSGNGGQFADINPGSPTGNETPTIANGQTVTVKTSATHFSRDGGNGTRMRSFVPGSTYTVMNFDDDEVMIGRNGVVTGWVKKTDLVGFDTGGYTGSWGSYGKMAMLHEKELVLNEGDTSNFLASMEVLERILEVIDLQSMNAQLGGLLNTPSFGNNSTSQTVEQNVHIEASFPGVSDRNEIEEAFNNLINTASQYANRKF